MSLLSASTGASPPAIDRQWLRAARRARLLASFSLAWLCFEGTATATAGLLAGSVALVANGLDGAIEGLASVIVVWRFSGSRTLSTTSERRAQRLVAASFFLLAPYVAFEAIRTLVLEHHAETTWLGIALSIGTLCVCPWLGRAKLHLGEQLGSAATAGEGRQNLICAYLAAGVLAGLLANTLLGIWWLDPTVALGIAALALREGRRSWRGEGCECATCAAPAQPQGRRPRPQVQRAKNAPEDELPDAPLMECRLDLAGLRSQRERFSHLSRYLERIERSPQRLEARFGPDLNTALLDEAIRTERECCPFFALTYDAAMRELAITVEDPDQNPALDALRRALTGSA